MIDCPSCKHQEFVGTVFCSECGSRLVSVNPVPTQNIPRERVDLEAMATKPAAPEGPELETGAILGLRVLATGDIISLIGRDNYTLGRSMEGQAILPDVDLRHYDAFDQGVSRIHSEIRLLPQGVHVVDLDSANGTLVAGKRIEPQKPMPVRHGDIIQVGGMRLQLISRFRG
ncbi:MAG: FHA domain-containing protein [Anaerolineales bacterium]|nr:FHA domain-containing protein [Anaerolineales bacterium]